MAPVFGIEIPVLEFLFLINIIVSITMIMVLIELKSLTRYKQELKQIVEHERRIH
jgi:hypothetical protein